MIAGGGRQPASTEPTLIAVSLTSWTVTLPVPLCDWRQRTTYSLPALAASACCSDCVAASTSAGTSDSASSTAVTVVAEAQLCADRVSALGQRQLADVAVGGRRGDRRAVGEARGVGGRRAGRALRARVAPGAGLAGRAVPAGRAVLTGYTVVSGCARLAEAAGPGQRAQRRREVLGGDRAVADLRRGHRAGPDVLGGDRVALDLARADQPRGVAVPAERDEQRRGGDRDARITRRGGGDHRDCPLPGCE